MREKILNILAEIEKKENVKILYCVDAGSRAAGLYSPDSDYDVRFVFVRNTADYLRLDPPRDVIEWRCDGTFDISGWDLRKALILGSRSNPSLMEWISSPIVYTTTEEWNRVADALRAFFSPRCAALHYLSMAKGNFGGEFAGGRIKYKKYFTVLRPLLALKWIVEKGEIPPVEFEKLTELIPVGDVEAAVTELTHAKRNGSKAAEGAPIGVINEYATETLAALENAVHGMPIEPRRGIESLNELFLQLVKNR